MRTFALACAIAATFASNASADSRLTPAVETGLWFRNNNLNIAGIASLQEARPVEAFAIIVNTLSMAPAIKEDIRQAWWPPTICDRPGAREWCSFRPDARIPPSVQISVPQTRPTFGPVLGNK